MFTLFIIEYIASLPLYSTGLLSSEGELWREQRRFTHTVLKDFGMGRGILEPKIHEEIQVRSQIIEHGP